MSSMLGAVFLISAMFVLLPQYGPSQALDGDDVLRKCICLNACSDDQHNGTCETYGWCFKHIKYDDNQYVTKMGCFAAGLHSRGQCAAKYLRPIQAIACCYKYDFCNADIEPTFSPADQRWIEISQMADGAKSSETTSLIVIGVATSATASLLFAAVLLIRYLRRRRQLPKESSLPSSMKELISGKTHDSGSDAPVLANKTIAHEIVLSHFICHGHFSELWKGVWRGESVLVKMYPVSHQQLWRQEDRVYRSVLLRHPNILNYVAADINPNCTRMSYIIVSEYVDGGTLRMFLSNSPALSTQRMLSLALTLISGMTFLHEEIHGVDGKPTLGHQILSPLSVLVRRGAECVISDFFLVARGNQEHLHSQYHKALLKLADARYLAPEVLADSNDFHAITMELIKMADIYSFGLLVWEIMHCTEDSRGGIHGDKYLPAYGEKFPDLTNPSDFIHEVVQNNNRPVLPTEWGTHPLMGTMQQLLQDCWHRHPLGRLPTLRIKKRILSAFSMASTPRGVSAKMPDSEPPC